MPVPNLTEIKYRGGQNDDFLEVAIDAGADASGIQIVVYHPNGSLLSTTQLNELQDTTFGRDLYALSAGLIRQGAVALAQNGALLDFVSFDRTVTAKTGPAAGATSRQISVSSGDEIHSDTDDALGSGDTNERAIPCFLAGTKIATRRGEIAVEDLRPGDHVMVRDGGFAPIRWIGSYCANARGDAFEMAAPIKIPRGAMGRGVPTRDLYVSPNHRVWMKDARFEMLFDEREVLIPAKQLVGWKGITQVSYVPTPEYFHILFDAHQIILSDGMLTESFHPSELSLDHFEHETRDELLRMFPELIEVAAKGSAARRCLKRHEARLAVQSKWVA